MLTRDEVIQSEADKKIQQEFNQWAEAGRGDEMEDHHSDITDQTIALMDLKPGERVVVIERNRDTPFIPTARRLNLPI